MKVIIFRHVIPICILLLGAWLRIHAAARDVRFHPDEALFASFARLAAVNGDWQLHGSLDKTPLTIYTQAVSMMLVGVTTLPDGVLTLDVRVGEFAARLPNMLVGIVHIAVLYALAWRLDGEKRKWTPLVVMGLAAVSPYLVAFSGTAFTDGVMLLCVTLALWMASRGGWFWAGTWLILGFCCKQQALLYLPLVVGMGISSPPSPLSIAWRGGINQMLKPSGYGEIKPTKEAGNVPQIPIGLSTKGVNEPFASTYFGKLLFDSLKFVLPMVVGFGLLVMWDSGRGQETSLWALAVANNDPGRLARGDELLPRLVGWGFYGQYLFGVWWMTAILSVMGAVSAVVRRHWVDGVLLGYVVIYLAGHWLIAINIYDRYLLLILPLMLLLVGRGVERLWIVGQNSLILLPHPQPLPAREEGRLYPYISSSKKGFAMGFVYVLIGIVMLFPAVEAANGRLPIGGDRGEHAGIDELGRFLESKPVATIIYDRWLGWELRYYLGAWPDERVVYYPTAEALAADAILQRDFAPRYFVAPLNRPYQRWVNLLDYAGFEIRLVYDQKPFVVYELIPPTWIGCASNAGSFWRGRTERFVDSCG